MADLIQTVRNRVSGRHKLKGVVNLLSVQYQGQAGKMHLHKDRTPHVFARRQNAARVLQKDRTPHEFDTHRRRVRPRGSQLGKSTVDISQKWYRVSSLLFTCHGVHIEHMLKWKQRRRYLTIQQYLDKQGKCRLTRRAANSKKTLTNTLRQASHSETPLSVKKFSRQSS